MRLTRWLAPGSVLVLMGLNVARLAGSDPARLEKTAVERAWSLPFAGAQSAIFTVLAPGGRPVVVLQTPRELALATPEGRLARSLDVRDVITVATGDLDGDGGDEVVLLRRAPLRVEARNEALDVVWTRPLDATREPSRVLAADLDGDGRAEVVVGGPLGLDALAPDGSALWTFRFKSEAAGEQGELRGLDDVRRPGARLVATARRDGAIVMLDGAGRPVTDATGAEVRRLRAADVDGDGRGEPLIGYDSGVYAALADDGQPRFSTHLGEAVVDIRKVETDGRRETAEVALGGKRGAVAVVHRDQMLFQARASARVSALGGVDADGDGRDEIVVGGEDGTVTVFGPTGARLADLRPGGKPERILALDTRDGGRLMLVAGGPSVAAYRLARVAAPAWYSPLTAGVLGVFGLVGLGLVLRRMRPPPPPKPAEGAGLPAAPLYAAQARVEALIAAGRLTREQAAERLEQLARQIAKVESAAGVDAAPPPPKSPPPPPRQA